MIYLNEGYYGRIGFHADDIATIVLKDRISISNGVAPVCIDWKGKYNIVNGDQGKVGLYYYLNSKIVIYITVNLLLNLSPLTHHPCLYLKNLYREIVCKSTYTFMLACYKT